MKTKILHGLLVMVLSCVVGFGVVAQIDSVAFAGETGTPTGETTVITPDPVMVTITFSANGGKWVAPQAKEQGKAIGDLPRTTKSKQSFMGWYTKRSGGTKISSETVVTGPATYYAHWAVTKKNITLNANGGKVKGSSTSKFTVNYGKKYGSKIVTPKRTGYKFSGWYTAKKGGTKVTRNTIVTIAKAKQTLYARWSAAKITVTFNANGGKIGTANTNKIQQTYNKRYILPVDPVRKGYEFKGWYTAKSGGSLIEASSKVKLTKNKTLFARWEKPFNADIVAQTELKLTGSGSGWHGKLVIQGGTSAFSFGIQHDTKSAIGSKTSDYLMIESVSTAPAYNKYYGYGNIGPGWHTLRMEWSRSKGIVRCYCDGQKIGEVPTKSLGNGSISINWEAVPRMTGDTVDASFMNTFVDSKIYKWGGTNDMIQEANGTYEQVKIGKFDTTPHKHDYFDRGIGWRLYGKANIPNGGDWDSYPLTGTRVISAWNRK